MTLQKTKIQTKKAVSNRRINSIKIRNRIKIVNKKTKERKSCMSSERDLIIDYDH